MKLETHQELSDDRSLPRPPLHPQVHREIDRHLIELGGSIQRRDLTTHVIDEFAVQSGAEDELITLLKVAAAKSPSICIELVVRDRRRVIVRG